MRTIWEVPRTADYFDSRGPQDFMILVFPSVHPGHVDYGGTETPVTYQNIAPIYQINVCWHINAGTARSGRWRHHKADDV